MKALSDFPLNARKAVIGVLADIGDTLTTGGRLTAEAYAAMERHGLTAKVSSIHVNGWFGGHDKLTMTKIMMRECFGIDPDTERERYVFVGDSPNDAPMFAHFPHAVGVPNIRNFEGRLAHAPAYIATQRGGAGFREVADFLLAARGI